MNNRILNSFFSTTKQNINQDPGKLLRHSAALKQLAQELQPLRVAPQLAQLPVHLPKRGEVLEHFPNGALSYTRDRLQAQTEYLLHSYPTPLRASLQEFLESAYNRNRPF